MIKKWEHNLALSTAKYLIYDVIFDFLYWPVWWFTAGAALFWLFCFKKIKDMQNYLGLSIWLKNLFTPMYAQFDWQGRLISFFIRLVMLIFKSFFLLIYSVIFLAIYLLWFLMPLIVVYEIIFNLKNLLTG
ncbi:hypothetical protein C4569_02720 [Candidatus Parcubacteria bacterium]|nr:MAG: hypothetical protein C4569_02720 [Candidatus Parcubacteria bacterium]